jgi:NhaP-type Na+/H+ or K+/H+ antiporter
VIKKNVQNNLLSGLVVVVLGVFVVRMLVVLAYSPIITGQYKKKLNEKSDKHVN